MILTVNDLGETVPLDAPWKAPQAEEWDSQSAGIWLRDNVVTPEARAVSMGNITTIFGLNPSAVSFLHLLWMAHAAGGVQNYGPVPGGAEEFRIIGGTQQIPLRIAARLGHRSLLLDSPVRELKQDADGVEVVSERDTLRARRVIVAIPTYLSGFIRYDPILPADRAQLIQRFPAGSAMKVQLIYKRAFWRDMGITGESFAVNSLVPQTLDAGGPAGVDEPGILGCFIGDDTARDLGRLSVAARQNLIIQELSHRFTAQVADLSRKIKPNYVEFNSGALEWARGDYAAYPGPRVYTASGFGPAIRQPVGRIHWAGVDTATIWSGSIDGAVQSGERAAIEVIHAG